MKTSSRLRLACVALALLLASASVYAARALPFNVSTSAAAQAHKKSTRRRRARRSTTRAARRPVPAAVGEGTDVNTAPPVSATEDEPPPPPQPKPTPRIARGPVQGGVLNGKAISKPPPAYPPIARAARASGLVTVQILVDEEGRVISASAVSGHPLLQQAAVAAARQARFSPTLLSGVPVKVTGVITYNFVLQ
jgi:TonB family protein